MCPESRAFFAHDGSSPPVRRAMAVHRRYWNRVQVLVGRLLSLADDAVPAGLVSHLKRDVLAVNARWVLVADLGLLADISAV